MENYYKNKEIGLKEIIFKHQQKCLDILSKELRLSKRVIPLGPNKAELVLEEEDTRISFIQAAQAFAMLIKPFFDEDMDEIYGDFDELVDMFTCEFYDKYKERIEKDIALEKKLFPEKYEEEKEEGEVPIKQIEEIHLRYRIRRSKQIFTELNLLLKRNDFLKGNMYSDDEDDEE